MTPPKTKEEAIQMFRKKFHKRNDCTCTEDKHVSTCTGCLLIIAEDYDDVESFLQEMWDHVRDEADKKGYSRGYHDASLGLSHEGAKKAIAEYNEAKKREKEAKKVFLASLTGRKKDTL